MTAKQLVARSSEFRLKYQEIGVLLLVEAVGKPIMTRDIINASSTCECTTRKILATLVEKGFLEKVNIFYGVHAYPHYRVAKELPKI